LWAVGTLFTLVTIALLVALLVVNRDAVKWEDLLARERIEQVALFIGIAVSVTTLIVLLAVGGASLGWTGFADKTLWEWLQLLGALAIPLVLAFAGFWFTSQQEKSGQLVEEQRAQDAALQAYLDQMGTLLLKEELRKSEEGSEVRTLARARTKTVLERLDSTRTAAVIEFLIEAELAQLIGLSGTNLSEVNLSGANLSSANLSDANLSGTTLIGATLIGADLSGANLSGAYLDDADLSGADLSGANLSDADLFGTDLFGADLSYADLSGAEGIIKERLEQQAGLLHGATMPDGTVLERYVTTEFEPALSFSLSDEWKLNLPEMPDLISFAGPERERGGLNFINPLYVFDPSNPSEPKEVPAPENAGEWVSWFRKHPNLDTSNPVQMSVGGKSAVRIDATFTSKTDSGTDGPGGPSAPLFQVGDATRIVSYGATKDRFIIVDVSEGETVIIQVSAPTGTFDEFLPRAQKVLGSVEWKGG
jgi:uncharacterized protein YjbI with pentapeptide repeats